MVDFDLQLVASNNVRVGLHHLSISIMRSHMRQQEQHLQCIRLRCCSVIVRTSTAEHQKLASSDSNQIING